MRCKKILGCVTLASIVITWSLNLPQTFFKYRIPIHASLAAEREWITGIESGKSSKNDTVGIIINSANGSCASNPCQNDAFCTNWRNQYICHCKEDFIGRLCEQSNDEKYRKREELWIEAVKNSTEKTKRKRLPDVIGIGVEKCGTGALIAFLRQHPLVKTPAHAETHFFNSKYGKGLNFYINMMPMVTDDEIIMEKTPAYFNFPPSVVPHRIKKDAPNAKLILVLCDPVNRTYSDYTQEKITGHVSKKSAFDDLVNKYLSKYNSTLTKFLHKPDSEAFSYITEIHKSDVPSHIFTTGLYYYHLLRWRLLFDSDDLYIVNGNDMISQPGIEFEKLQKFLNLPRMLLKEDFVYNEKKGFFCFEPKSSNKLKKVMKKYNPRYCLGETKGRTRNQDSNIGEETINSLRRFYRPFNEKLFQFLDRKMAWQ